LRFAGFFAATAFLAAGLRFAAVFFLATAIFFTSSTSATVFVGDVAGKFAHCLRNRLCVIAEYFVYSF
jgi:hypothetical protein